MLIRPFRILTNIARMRSALVLLCLLSFAIVSIAHAGHHLGGFPAASSVELIAASGDGDKASDGLSGSDEICLACALASAPLQLFSFPAPDRFTARDTRPFHAVHPGHSRAESPPPKA